MFKKVWGIIRTWWEMIREAFAATWEEIADNWKKSPWWKLVFIDMPIVAISVFLTFTVSYFWIGEAILIALAMFNITDLWDPDGALLEKVTSLFVGLVAFGVVYFLFWNVRELVILGAIVQAPRLTNEAREAYVTARDHIAERLSVKIEREEGNELAVATA